MLTLLQLLAPQSKLSVHEEYTLRKELEVIQVMLTLVRLLTPPPPMATYRSRMRQLGPQCTSGTYLAT